MATPVQIGWITEDAITGLVAYGGFSKRGTVPVHANQKRFARIPVYVNLDDNLSPYMKEFLLDPKGDQVGESEL